MVKKRIGVLFGGRSAEHAVSLRSAAAAIRALDAEKFVPICVGITSKGEWKLYKGNFADVKYSAFAEALKKIEDGSWEKEAESISPCEIKEIADFALPMLHGPYGEDGRIQGFLETLGVPFGGCGTEASALAIDKCVFKKLMESEGLPVCRYACLRRRDIKGGVSMARTLEKVEKDIGFPCFVKPARMGSSVGISKAKDRASLAAALKTAAAFDSDVLVEEYVPCRELEVAALGNGRPQLTDVGEILHRGEFYDYETKYAAADQRARLVPSARIPHETREKIKEMAARAYEAIGAEGFGRIDFFCHKETGRVYLNEINTIPGFTENSMFPLLWQAAGLDCGKIIERIIDLGYERSNAENYG